uniref:hypothetical protein n=1 Tax=Wolbachia endosymbiont (group A) of Scambus nigricans TaxID=2954055 RepID=UPI002230E596|nr:hypothetical protein [Wolbachia endosymbiont (group A) of Scambus nigricans]
MVLVAKEKSSKELAKEGLLADIQKIHQASIALFTIIRTDRNMLLACYSHKHISYHIRTIIRKAINADMEPLKFTLN